MRADDRARARGRREHVRAGAVHRLHHRGRRHAAVRVERRLRQGERHRLVPPRRAGRLGHHARTDAASRRGRHDWTAARAQHLAALLQRPGADQRSLRPQRLQALRRGRRRRRLRHVPDREVLRARLAPRHVPRAARADDDLRARQADIPVDRDEQDDRRVPDDRDHAADRQRRDLARGRPAARAASATSRTAGRGTSGTAGTSTRASRQRSRRPCRACSGSRPSCARPIATSSSPGTAPSRQARGS